MENLTQSRTPQGGYNEDEINLMDYFQILYKRKNSIIIIFLVVVIIAMLTALILPKTFEASALLRIGVYQRERLENIADVQEIFKTEVVLQEIARELALPEETVLKELADRFNVGTGGKEDGEVGFLRIAGQGKTPEEAVEVVGAINKILVNRHQGLFEQARKTLEKEIELIQKTQEKVRGDIKLTEDKIVRLEKDIAYYEKEIQARGSAQSEAQGRIVESYIKLLADFKNQKENNVAQIANLNQELANLDAALQQKEYEKAYETRPTVVEMPPVLPQTKIAPNRTQIVMVAGVLGLFVGILYAFAAEYVSQHKEEFKKKS